MHEQFRNLRKEYSGEPLVKHTLLPDPYDQFKKWFQDAIAAGCPDPHVMSLATVGADNAPSVRIVLLQHFDRNGFIFYTNYNSRKGKEIGHNPNAAVLFYWPQLQRQVRIDGKLQRVAPETSEAYFQQRPRGSQIAAWVSPQSEELDNKEALAEAYAQFGARFSEKEIPCPEFWGGYALTPASFEFWQGQANRLHDRIRYLYDTTEDAWNAKRLAP